MGLITDDAARVAGLSDKLGRIRPGAAADLVLERHHPDPWESVLPSRRD